MWRRWCTSQNFFWHLLVNFNQKSQSYDVRFLRYRVRPTEFFIILAHFLSFYSPSHPMILRIKIFKKFKKMLRNINLFYMCNINEDHMIYRSRNIRYDIQVLYKWQLYDVWFLRYGAPQTERFLSSWAVFCHFTPLWTQKTKLLPGDIIILQMCTINGNHMMYGSWDMEHDEQNFSSFWTIFYPFTLLTTQKIKILKK